MEELEDRTFVLQVKKELSYYKRRKNFCTTSEDRTFVLQAKKEQLWIGFGSELEDKYSSCGWKRKIASQNVSWEEKLHIRM